MTNDKTILVTGATGYIGRHLVAKLVNEEYRVVVLARDILKAKNLSPNESIAIHYFDLTKPFEEFEIPEDSVLYHCAWSNIRDTLNLCHIEKNFIDNYVFLKNMVNKGIKKIIVTGSCYEYGLQYGPVSVHQKIEPNTPYALGKDFLHKSLHILRQQKDFSLIWARLFYIFGDNQDNGSVIDIFDKALENNDTSFNMTYGEQLFDYLAVEKVAEYLVLLLQKNNGIYNICKGEPISIRRLLENRMRAKGKSINLNLGHYEYRRQDSIAIWGSEPFESQFI